uniref:Uncharacterized protein n=1 Tax=Musa acuminata subsp. malaccensis TaxID=214687 RepID=A0A804K763_MUSAM
MGHVIHMLEVDDFPYRDNHRAGKDPRKTYRDSPQERGKLLEQPMTTVPSNNSGNDNMLDILGGEKYLSDAMKELVFVIKIEQHLRKFIAGRHMFSPSQKWLIRMLSLPSVNYVSC